LDSYNNFVYFTLPDIINNSVSIKTGTDKFCYIEFFNIQIEKPHVNDTVSYGKKIMLFPSEVRIRDLTYEARVLCDIRLSMIHNNVVKESSLQTFAYLFSMPVMVGSTLCNGLNSKECEHDKGGYFYINGKKKAVVSVEIINYNHIFVYKCNDMSHVCEVRSVKKSSIDYSILTQIKVSSQNTLSVILQQSPKKEFPLCKLFIALGADISEIESFIRVVGHPIVKKSIFHIKGVTKEEALSDVSKFLTNRKISTAYVEQILQTELLPHLGLLSTNKNKCVFLGLMVRQLLLTLDGKRSPDDRDHIFNKRVETVGELIGTLVKPLFKNLLHSLRKKVTDRTTLSNITTYIKSQNITKVLHGCFAKGRWGIPKSNYIREGIAQNVVFVNHIGADSYLRKIIVTIGKGSKNTKIRQLHNSKFGFTDPNDTPEGEMCGIVSNFATFNRVSFDINFCIVADVLNQRFKFKEFGESKITDVVVKVNGFILGFYSDPALFVSVFKTLRCQRIIHPDISICYSSLDQTIDICCNGGRLLRAVFRVFDDLDKQIQEAGSAQSVHSLWKWLIDNSVVVYIDGKEQDESNISMWVTNDTAYDYCEIHPSAMLGMCAGLTPFSNFSQSPRNIYECSMFKQAIGVYATNFNHRFDSPLHILSYPQKRIVSTAMSEFMGDNDLPCSTNVIIAVSPFHGFNQEDSVILNESAVQRGLFVSTSYKTVDTTEDRRKQPESEEIRLPPMSIRRSNFNYLKLDVDGIVCENVCVDEGDVLIGKVVINETGCIRDKSIICRESGVVDKVCVTKNSKGNKHIKIKIRCVRRPEIGDKFSSCEAQKGTCGMVYRQEDLPFTTDGIVPDIIINPHAFPSRMTINLLMEILIGKLTAITGEQIDATTFGHDGESLMAYVFENLKKYGVQSLGWEFMTNGETGEPLKAPIYVGVCSYQKLRHLVAEKMHVRSWGNVDPYTQQPNAGRSRDGGLRCGEMEKDCMIAHGTSHFCMERLNTMSDPFQVDVCINCGFMTTNREVCSNCDSKEICSTNLPFAAKLFFHQISAFHIKTGFKIKKI
jgi:DNA-directed RNA polymerase II subunit RPB2